MRHPGCHRQHLGAPTVHTAIATLRTRPPRYGQPGMAAALAAQVTAAATMLVRVAVASWTVLRTHWLPYRAMAAMQAVEPTLTEPRALEDSTYVLHQRRSPERQHALPAHRNGLQGANSQCGGSPGNAAATAAETNDTVVSIKR